MKKIKLKASAKINLTLDVLGVTKEGYHSLRSLVASIDLCDYITLRARKDFNINLKCAGLDAKCSAQDNNAYKSAKLFLERFKTKGVDIKIKKKIPVGGGLGGSSADIAGVLKGLKLLYGIEEDLAPIANRLGSDSSYMLKGGWAILNDRGDKQQFLQLNKRLYLIILTADKSVSARDSYNGYDQACVIYPPCTDSAFKALENGDFACFCAQAKNDLQPASCNLVPQIKDNITALKSAGAPLAIMTGSGSVALGVFDKERDRDSVYKKLKREYKKKILKAKTI